MNRKAVKFGGTSLCDANRMKMARDIVLADAGRRVIVVSAPGKRFQGDEKITDLLIRASGAGKEEKEALLDAVRRRFDEIIEELALPLFLEKEYAEMRRLEGDALVSRGEYFSARIFSALLGFPFFDAKELIFFGADGGIDAARTRAAFSGMEYAVIPGFYGSFGGKIRLFSRGGSDISGAIAADAVDAEIYENFTDVEGFLLADPKLVREPVTVPLLSYRELRALSSMGAGVLHADAVLPLRDKQIPVVIRSTFFPHGAHSWVVSRKEKGIGGIASLSGYTMLTVERAGLFEDKTAMEEALAVLKEHGLIPVRTAMDTDAFHAVIPSADYLAADKAAGALQAVMDAQLVTVRCGLSLIVVAGEGLTPQIHAEILHALQKASIRPLFWSASDEGFLLTLCLLTSEEKAAVSAIYETLKEKL